MSTLVEAIAKWFYGPDHIEDWPIIDDEVKSEYHEAAASLIQLLREQGLVQLDKDQSLPESDPVHISLAEDAIYQHAIRDVRAAGFRKIHELGEL